MVGFLILFVYAWDYSQNGRDWTGLCFNGGAQSPININPPMTTNISSSLPEYFFLSLNYTLTQIVNQNTSSLSGFNYNPTKSFYIFSNFGQITNGTIIYDSRFIKFHSPSEHTINYTSFPLELQIVHKNGGDTLILVVFFQYSVKENSFLQDVINAFGSVVGGTVKLNDAIGGWFAIKNFWYYEGSNSEPDCYEGVKYVVYQNVMPATVEQISFFSGLLQGNARELMPQNSRPVSWFQGLTDKVGFSGMIGPFFVFFGIF